MEKYAFNNGLSPTWLPKKLMMVMKLIIVLMTTCLMQVSAAGFAQKLTYVKRGATLEQIFSEIRKQTGYFVVYAEDKVDKQARLDVNFRQAQLKDVLDVVSKSQNLNYTINENNIGLKPKEESFIDRIVARFQSIDVRGKVVDSLGNGLAGATVSVKNGKQSTQTLANGDFYLKNVDEGAVLVVSYLGYVTKEQTTSKEFNYIQLQLSTSKLDDGKITLKIPNAKLWSPDDPFLYDLEVILGKDKVKSYFGMRKISVGKDEKGIDRIMLNNKPYFNLGTLDQGFWPDGLYTAPTDEALKFDIQAIKAMGFNTIRKHIKVEPARWYYHADKLGMLVWQDMVNPNQGLPEGSKQAFEQQNKETIAQLYNYPSITTWVLFNEKWGQYDQARLTSDIKKADPSRLVNGHSGEYLYVNNQLRSPSPDAYINADMTDVHSYPNPMNSEKQAGKARVLGEFGGIGVPIENHLWDDTKTGWGYDGIVTPQKMKMQYSQMIDSLVKLKAEGLSGSIYTQPFDVETEQNGIMTYDREIIKLKPEELRTIHAKLQPVTANYLSATKGFTAKVADTISKTYQERLVEYKAGNRNPNFLRSLAFIAESQKDSKNLSLVTNEYVKGIKDPFVLHELKFIEKFVSSTKDLGFQILYNDAEKANRLLGGNKAGLRIEYAIFNDYVEPYLKNDRLTDWKIVENSIGTRFGRFGEEALWQAQIFFSLNHNDWDLFGKVAKRWFEKYGINREDLSGMLNDMAWKVFENSKDTLALEAALIISKKTVQSEDNPNSMDTYANLLYKLGRVEEAIRWQKKAVALVPPYEKSFRETLDKMQKGLKTWPESNN